MGLIVQVEDEEKMHSVKRNWILDEAPPDGSAASLMYGTLGGDSADQDPPIVAWLLQLALY